jgi:hypothetical protein
VSNPPELVDEFGHEPARTMITIVTRGKSTRTKTTAAARRERLATYDQAPTDPARDERDVDLLGELHFGFPHLTDEAQR